MPNGNISLLLQLLHWESKQTVLVGLRTGTSKSPGAGENKIQLLCFSPVSLKVRTSESKSGTPVTKKWRKHPAKKDSFFCFEALKWLTLFTSHFLLCLNSLPVGVCFHSVCVPAHSLLLRSRSPASAWKGAQQETLSNKYFNALKGRKWLEGSFLCKQRRGNHWSCPDRVTLVKAI